MNGNAPTLVYDSTNNVAYSCGGEYFDSGASEPSLFIAQYNATGAPSSMYTPLSVASTTTRIGACVIHGSALYVTGVADSINSFIGRLDR